ncbi:hypothetical protein BDB00DRAFT_789751 [Zychaea mexicana]|uniref:uncharacterized protein n=1 Tax=Zychaea mexicana TaxID=64656 RepID=UPI0022FE7639|nr:uncharacterized protein BDB00DRAFT_789751 [Zychaea mexicana]KAI9491220.1 hypothetical protein BDB00DRAFT_789751 [Zychaea mexicana]
MSELAINTAGGLIGTGATTTKNEVATAATTPTTTTTIKQQQDDYNGGDRAVIQLLSKLDEGTQTIANLRSILTLKTAELNELVAQLELANQAIINVDTTTTQIETMLKDMGLSGERNESVLMHAEATLDSAIKSASCLYDTPSAAATPKRPQQRRPSMASSNDSTEQRRMSARFTTRIRYKPDTKYILRQLNELLRDLELDSAKFFEGIGTTDDVQALQKAKVDLDIARTIALSAKSNMKRRTILLRSASRRRNAPEEIKMWKQYARGAPMIVDGKDIIETLDREDALIAQNLPVHPSRMSFDGYASTKGSPTPSSSSTTRASMRNSLSTRTTDSRPTHSRTSSLHAGTPTTESAIPVPSFQQQLPPVPPIPPSAASAAAAAAKKIHRHSAAARASMRASSGATRVRTSSLTSHKATKEKPVRSSMSAIPAPPSSLSSSTTAAAAAAVTTTTPPQSPSMTAASSTTKTNSSAKGSQQRGPGSTLRIRSMLARRNVQQQ